MFETFFSVAALKYIYFEIIFLAFHLFLFEKFFVYNVSLNVLPIFFKFVFSFTEYYVNPSKIKI